MSLKLFLCITLLTIGGWVIQAQNNTEYSAVEAIKELHEGWLVVRLPGFERKLAVIDSLLKISELSDKRRHDLERERMNTLKNRDFIWKWYPVIFDTAYHFSKVAFIKMEETTGFQENRIPARAPDGQRLDSVSDQKYLFATLSGIQNYPFVFTTRDHRKPAYPFPVSIGPWHHGAKDLFSKGRPQWIIDLGPEAGAVNRLYKHVSRVNRKLTRFYQRQYLRE